jgi:hypothetical protein
MIRWTILLLAACATAASAQTPAPAARSSATAPVSKPQQNPIGTYDLEVAFGGGTLPGVLTIASLHDSLSASLHVGPHEPAVKSFAPTGSRYTLVANAGDVDVVYDLAFRADTVSGTFTRGDQLGSVRGTRRK